MPIVPIIEKNKIPINDIANIAFLENFRLSRNGLSMYLQLNHARTNARIEKTIIETLKEYKIETFSDKDNIGIWHKKNNSINKVAAIGVRVKKWIAYHGFAININNNLEQYKKIIPCGIANKGVTNLIKINNNDYSNLDKILIEKFISNLKI